MILIVCSGWFDLGWRYEPEAVSFQYVSVSSLSVCRSISIRIHVQEGLFGGRFLYRIFCFIVRDGFEQCSDLYFQIVLLYDDDVVNVVNVVNVSRRR